MRSVRAALQKGRTLLKVYRKGSTFFTVIGA